jgi:hypothetical protein
MNVKFIQSKRPQHVELSPAKKVKKTRTSEQRKAQAELLNTITIEKGRL